MKASFALKNVAVHIPGQMVNPELNESIKFEIGEYSISVEDVTLPEITRHTRELFHLFKEAQRMHPTNDESLNISLKVNPVIKNLSGV
jgi:hypothetical protein